MDGLGLPVCWAACPGPGLGYATDGQCIVSTDGMDAPAEFITRNVHAEYIQPGRIDGPITATLTETEERVALAVLRRIATLDGRGWTEFIGRFTSPDVEMRRKAATMAGLPRKTFDSADSAQSRLVASIAAFGAEEFCILRQRMAEGSCTSTAKAMGVTKQAVSKRERKMRRKAAWYGKFVAGSGLDGAFSCGKGDITPKNGLAHGGNMGE